MRTIVAGLFISVDGLVETPEQWTGPYFNDEVGQAVGSLIAAGDTLLLGRGTYQSFAASFGGQSGGMADDPDGVGDLRHRRSPTHLRAGVRMTPAPSLPPEQSPMRHHCIPIDPLQH